jgi:aryl-alcohol dehydrogenase-like predicted oxidoreductase
VLSQPFDAYAVIGVTKPEHLADALGALEIELSLDEIAWLDLRAAEVEVAGRRLSA